jgi:hypothetical protein
MEAFGVRVSIGQNQSPKSGAILIQIVWTKISKAGAKKVKESRKLGILA